MLDVLEKITIGLVVTSIVALFIFDFRTLRNVLAIFSELSNSPVKELMILQSSSSSSPFFNLFICYGVIFYKAATGDDSFFVRKVYIVNQDFCKEGK